MAARALSAFALVAAAMAAGCSEPRPTYGLMVVMEIDPSWNTHADTLRLRIESADGQTSLWDQSYPLVHAPMTFAVVPRANTDVSAVIVASVGVGAAPPDDVRTVTVDHLPNHSVAELDVLFDGVCHLASSGCPCATRVDAQTQLPAYPGNVFAPIPCPAAAGDGGVDAAPEGAPDASVDNATTSADGASGDGANGDGANGDGANGDGANGDGANGDGASADGASPDAGCEGGTCADAAPRCAVPRDCVEGQTHCVAGACIPVPLSCQGAGAGAGFNCGGVGGSDDCCATYEVPGGTFLRDYDGVSYTDATNPATVSPFDLDGYEVTVGRFRKFVSAVVNGWRPPALSGKHVHLNGGYGLVSPAGLGSTYEPGWLDSWTPNLPTDAAGWDAHLTTCNASTWVLASGAGGDDLPIACIDWYDAYAFCIWDGGFLPSGAEWNFAAAGGSEQRVYAWGNQAPPYNETLAVWDCYRGRKPDGTCDAQAAFAPVGTAPLGNGKWGQSDLTGSVFEYTLEEDIQEFINPCVDCASTALSSRGRDIRGGSCIANINQMPVSGEIRTPESVVHTDVGVRCARPPGQ
jgi:formylglycine-generating enzyme required for sulfatase activity